MRYLRLSIFWNRNSRPVPHARLAKSVVCSSCHGVYVFPFGVRLCVHLGLYGTLQASGELTWSCRQVIYGIWLFWQSVYWPEQFRQSSLGTLLELGSERNLGSSYVDRRICCTYICACSAGILRVLLYWILIVSFAFATDVLVWSELPSCRTVKAYIYLTVL